MVYAVYLYRGDALDTSRGELIADGARTGEEVQDIARLELHEVSQHVEEVLLRKVGCRACPQVAGRVDGTTLILTTDDAHSSLGVFSQLLKIVFEEFSQLLRLLALHAEGIVFQAHPLVQALDIVEQIFPATDGYHLGQAQ